LAVKLRVVLAVKIGELKRPRGIDGVESDLTAAEEIDGIAEFISRAGDASNGLRRVLVVSGRILMGNEPENQIRFLSPGMPAT
jgi:hypothetical protein